MSFGVCEALGSALLPSVEGCLVQCSCRYARVSLDPGQEGWSEVHLMLLDVCISPELQSKLGELSSPS